MEEDVDSGGFALGLNIEFDDILLEICSVVQSNDKNIHLYVIRNYHFLVI